MIGLDSEINGSPSNDSNTNLSAQDYLRLAKSASSNGDQMLAAYLYIAAFEKDSDAPSGPQQATIAGLRKAWKTACENKQRSLAEHIFEMLEPYSSEDEIKQYAKRLQDMTLDKLEDFGFSREDLEDISETISAEFPGSGLLSQMGLGQLGSSDEGEGEGESRGSAILQPGLLIPPATPFGKVTEYRSSEAKPAKKDAGKASDSRSGSSGIELYGYDELVGYDAAIDKMRDYGIGVSGDDRFKSFLEMLSRHHGITSLPAVQTLVFRSEAREDATHFMAATVGELSQPTVRMYMDESPQGVPVLCVMASNDFKPRFQFLRSGFDTPTVLMLEDVDLWSSPLTDPDGDFDLSQLGRGAREAMSMIRSAVDNPNVTVVASVGGEGPLDSFLFEMLEPIDFIDISLPDAEERAAVWKHACELYPSLRQIDLDDLVRLSKGLSRFEIYTSAREAAEQAYRESMHRRGYVPVLPENVFGKVSTFLPLDSPEYAEIEQKAMDSFRRDLAGIDDLLEGDRE